MKTIRLTAAQALVRYLTNQFVRADDGAELPLFAGVWAIFGHGNVAGIGEALYQVKDQLPPRDRGAADGAGRDALCWAHRIDGDAEDRRRIRTGAMPRKSIIL